MLKWVAASQYRKPPLTFGEVIPKSRAPAYPVSPAPGRYSALLERGLAGIGEASRSPIRVPCRRLDRRRYVRPLLGVIDAR